MEHLTFFRIKALPGRAQAVVDQFDKWDKEHKSRAKGFQRSLLVSGNEDPSEFMVAVRFNTTESYQANSGRQEQGDWYGELRANLVSDPVWFDGTLVKEAKA